MHTLTLHHGRIITATELSCNKYIRHPHTFYQLTFPLQPLHTFPHTLHSLPNTLARLSSLNFALSFTSAQRELASFRSKRQSHQNIIHQPASQTLFAEPLQAMKNLGQQRNGQLFVNTCSFQATEERVRNANPLKCL